MYMYKRGFTVFPGKSAKLPLTLIDSDGRMIRGAATDCTLSLTTAWVLIPACERVASESVLAGVFAGYFGFLHYLQLASHELPTILHKCDEKRNSKIQRF